ncbi:di-trans,poly-cis-decaprenylcistransferase [Candidatus Peregrinibacteria bacterium]|nr:MAG: di-trans,poly-cis-decaprenylcistransferase [Candidatus Peregrinibacteria bacterium]
MHVAAIMDGNRRWAVTQGWKKIIGHKYGVKSLENMLRWCRELDVKTFSVYALSTENLARSELEVGHLFALLGDFSSNISFFLDLDISVKMMGNLDLLPEKLQRTLKNLEDQTKQCGSLDFQVCIAYGGKDEIIRAARKICDAGEEITEENLEKYLDSPAQPDLIIRTGGNKRLSNFLMWQSAYSELYFIDKYWPEFEKNDLVQALDFYHNQKRNFGK